MNIVIFTDFFLPNVDGISISVHQFCERLLERGHSITLCCPKYGLADFEQPHPNMRIIRFHDAPLPSYPAVKIVLPSISKLRQAMTEFTPDVVHIQTPGLLGQYGVLAAKWFQVPVVGTYHTLVAEQSMYISPYYLFKFDALFSKLSLPVDFGRGSNGDSLRKRLIFKLTNSFYETTRLVLCPSLRIKTELQRRGLTTPMEVVSNGINLADFCGEVRQRPTGVKLVYVGRVSYEKNCEVLLAALKKVLEKKPDATLDIIGDGPAMSFLKRKARLYGVLDRVIFHGFIAHENLAGLYPRYDLFLTASTMETQGLAVLEALSCGLPAVGVDAYALPELIRHDRNGFTVPPGDSIAMGECVLQILNDVELYRRFSTASLEIAGEHDLENCTTKLESVYRGLIQGLRYVA